MQTLILPHGNMDLASTLFCGQSFIWHESPVQTGAFSGVAGGRAATVWLEGEHLCIQQEGGCGTADEAFWRDYFALDLNYTALEGTFCTHKKLAACVEAGRGIRVLRQPFWDTLLSFIISQNNNIKRITGIVNRLCAQYGPEVANGIYGFPAPEVLAALTPEDLSSLRAGFRAKYLIDAAKKVAGGEVNEATLRAASDDEAREILCRIHGVGTKVADCVLLYSLGRNRVVPMDVWMKRALEVTFPRGMPRVTKGYEGIAQQYIFCWARENL